MKTTTHRARDLHSFCAPLRAPLAICNIMSNQKKKYVEISRIRTVKYVRYKFNCASVHGR